MVCRLSLLLRVLPLRLMGDLTGNLMTVYSPMMGDSVTELTFWTNFWPQDAAEKRPETGADNGYKPKIPK
jgi:hypothetical protein